MKPSCSIDGCEKTAHCRGWCKMHYTRWSRDGDVGESAPRIRPPEACLVDGCERVARSKRYCHAHYTRVRRTGEPGPVEVWDKKLKPCSIDGCETVARSLGMCNVHHLRWSRHRDLNRDSHRDNHTRWLAREDLNYEAAHDRVKRYRGVASTHLCACGVQAQDWAYLHTDPEPLRDERGRPFSDDVDAYAPMCRHCHKTFDWAVKREQVLREEEGQVVA